MYKLLISAFVLIKITKSEWQCIDENGNSKCIDHNGKILYQSYPCIGVETILETFSSDEPYSYNVTLSLKEIVEDYFKKIDFVIKFDSLANITIIQERAFANYFSDSKRLEATLPYDEKPEKIIIRISPYPNQPIPNVISFTVNNIQICKNGVDKDIWRNYIITTTTTTTTTTPSPSSRNDKSELNCGRKPAAFEPFIHHGSSGKQGDWPWHSALYRLNTKNSQLKYICGGTLISDSRILTAGHCVVEQGSIISPERLYVTLGKFNFIWDEEGIQEKRVFDIILHPQFSPLNLTNDIAILKLATKVPFTEYVQPICLDLRENYEKSEFYGTNGVVVGWGATESSSYSDHLVQVTMPIRSDLECLKKDPGFFGLFLNDGNFCVGFENGTNVCNGDSGGGFYVAKNDSDGKEYWTVLGIISLGSALPSKLLCNPKHYVLFTNILYYADFIQSHM